MSLSDALNEAAARAERSRDEQERQASAEKAQREAEAEPLAAELNAAARAVAQAASDAGVDSTTYTYKKFLRAPETRTTRRTSFYLCYLWNGRDLTVSISIAHGFELYWQQSDSRSMGVRVSLVDYLAADRGNADGLQRRLGVFMAEHQLRI